jgi:hypothetical protein
MDNADEAGDFFTFLGTKAGVENAEADATKKPVAATENFMAAPPPTMFNWNSKYKKIPTTKILWPY